MSARIYLQVAHQDAQNPILNAIVETLGKRGARFRGHGALIQDDTTILAALSWELKNADYAIVTLSKETQLYAGFPPGYGNSINEILLDTEIHKVVFIRLDDTPIPDEFYNQVLGNCTFVDFSRNPGEALNVLSEIVFSQGFLGSFGLYKTGNYVDVLSVCEVVSSTLIEHLAKHPHDMYKLPAHRFEELIAELFRGFGYDVELTATTRDNGIDVVAIRRRELETRYLIECKKYAPDRRVGVGVVKQLYATKTMEAATKAILATTAYFSQPAIKYFETKKWEMELRDYDGIQRWLQDYVIRKRRSVL